MVHVLCIVTRHRTKVSVHSTNGKARKELDGYVKSNWADMFNDPYHPSMQTPMPKLREKRIEVYFDKTHRIGVDGAEYHEILKREVDAA